jgi:hypothetical protein
MTATKMQFYRKEVQNMHKAQLAGTASFELLAEMHGSKIHRINYRDLEGIYCDTMAVYKGRTVFTKENLQYFPAKVHVCFALSN